MVEAKLLIVGGVDGLREIRLGALPMTLGRSEEADICLPQALVSRTHCEIYEEDELLHVRDLGSTNGTFVGNQRVDQSILRPGDLLTVGTVTFRAVYDGIGDEGFDDDSDVIGALEDTTPASHTTQIGRPPVDAAETETLCPAEDTVPTSNLRRLK